MNIDLKLYPKSSHRVSNLPCEVEEIPLDDFDEYMETDLPTTDIGKFGKIFGVYSSTHQDLAEFTHAELRMSISDIKISPIEFKLVVLKRNPRSRRNEIFARMKQAYNVLRPYRNRVHDTIIHIVKPCGTYAISVRGFSRRVLDNDIKEIEYKKQVMKPPVYNRFAAVYKFVERIHRYYALLGMIQAAEADTNGVPRKLYERHVLRIVKEFL